MHAITLLFIGLSIVVTNGSKIVCYYGSWATYRPGNGKFDVTDIDPTLCTHIIYTFLGITEEGEIKILDPALDSADDGGKDNIGKFIKHCKTNPKIKVMIAVGGWNEGSVKYSKVVSTETGRETFATNIVTFVKKYGFDGFDIDWEYPNQRGGTEDDVENFVLLLENLREKFDPENLILSIAAPAFRPSAILSYNASEICKYVDFINLMAYDAHGAWENRTGMNAPLYSGSWEDPVDKDLNIDSAILYWVLTGAPNDKLVLGMPLYGRGFTLDDPNNHEPGSPAQKPSVAGPYTQEAGLLGYNEICEKFKNENWTVIFNEEVQETYAYNNDQWISFDDERSLKAKISYLKTFGLGGAMVWSLESDDFKGICGKKYPLLNTIKSSI